MTAHAPGETRCSVCNETLPATARFCLSCGAPQGGPVDQDLQDLRKTVTLLFCDVTGSTALGERLDPEVLRVVMGRYFDVAKAAVERHGGTVEKFVGDAVLAVFGIPEVREDDALRAVRAAFDMQGELKQLSGELTTSMGIGIAVRIGVNTGPVVTGTARAGGSFATGDAVNTAARLEQAATPGEVLLGASTWSLVRDAVEVEALVPIAAKGKAEPLPAYRLVLLLESDRGRNRRNDGVLVGRDRESQALADALARTTAGGRSHLVTVLGAAGMGKTRLVEDFLARDADHVRVLRGRCVSYGRGITFWPIVQLLRQAASLTGEETSESTARALLALLDGAPDKVAIVEGLMPLLGLGGEPGGSDETFWAVRCVLEHVAAQGSLVVTVDDIHWAEPTLLDLLERIRDEARDVPLLIVCQARPELIEQRPGWGGGAVNATTFLLEPMTGRQTAELLEGLLGSGVPNDVVVTVDGWAGGNPLFVEEVTTHLIEEGVLHRQNGAWSVGDLTKVKVPGSVTALLAARLDRLPPEERGLVERISVVGLEVTTKEAQALSPDQAVVPSLLASLSRRDLLRRVRGLRAETWAFRHVLLREAAYEGLPKTARAQLHEQFADRLQASAADAGGEVHAFVGHHLEQAVRLRRELSSTADVVDVLARRAARTLAAAAAHARENDDLSAAIGLLQRAIVVRPAAKADRRELLWRLAQVQQDAGRYAESREMLEQLVDLLDDDTSELERSSAEAEMLNVRSMASEQIDPAVLRSAAETAIHHARHHHDDRRLAQALKVAVDAAATSGLWAEAARRLREVERVGSGYDRRVARIWMVAAYIWGEAPVDEGLAYIASLRERSGQTARSVALLQVEESALLAASGRIAEALAAAAEGEGILRELDPIAIGTTAFLTLQVHLATGDTPAALRCLEDGIKTLEDSGGLAYASTLLGWKAALLLGQGENDEAVLVIERAAAVTSPYDNLSVGLVHTCRAVVAARRGDDAAAAAWASEALAAADGSDQTVQRADVRRWLSEIPRRAGDKVEQRRLLLEARDLYRAKGHLPLTAAIERMLSEVES